MDPDVAFCVATPRDRHVGTARPPRDQAPQPRGRLVAEHGPLAAGENRRKAAAVLGHRGVANRVGAAMEEMQAATPDGATDRRS